jgi:predicted nucleotidyltransferase
MKVSTDELLGRIVETIVEAAQPERVILFGSRAKGADKGESDYDFLVVVSGAENEREVSRRIYRSLLDKKVGVAVDVVVVGEKKLERYKESPYFIYAQAVQEGKLFYDRAAAV